MADFDDEFRFLQGDADLVGRSGPLPEVQRVSITAPDGRSVSALQFQPAQAPAYAFVHGMGLNAHGFDPVTLRLGVPALSIDLPGHGRSDWRDDANYGPDMLAPDLVAMLAAYAPEPFTLVGHSLGALSAVLAATAVSDRLRGLILVDITPGVRLQSDAGAISDFISGQRDFASLEEMVDRAIAYGIGEDRDALMRGVALNSRRRADGRWEWAHHFAHMEGSPTDGFGDGEPFAPLWTPLAELAAGGVPISLIHASDGIVRSEQVEQWHERFPESRTIEVAGLHNLHEGSPVALAEAIEQLRA